MAQPGVLVLKKDGGVLFDWAIHPGVVCSFSSLSVFFGDLCQPAIPARVRQF